MLDVSAFIIHPSAFPGRALSGFQGSGFKVQGSGFPIGCWMFDVGCFPLPPSAFCLLPPPFRFQDFSISAFQLLSSGSPFCFLLSQFLLFPSSEAQLLEEFNWRDDGNAEGFLQDQEIAILSDEE